MNRIILALLLSVMLATAHAQVSNVTVGVTPPSGYAVSNWSVGGVSVPFTGTSASVTLAFTNAPAPPPPSSNLTLIATVNIPDQLISYEGSEFVIVGNNLYAMARTQPMKGYCVSDLTQPVLTLPAVIGMYTPYIYPQSNGTYLTVYMDNHTAPALECLNSDGTLASNVDLTASGFLWGSTTTPGGQYATMFNPDICTSYVTGMVNGAMNVSPSCATNSTSKFLWLTAWSFAHACGFATALVKAPNDNALWGFTTHDSGGALSFARFDPVTGAMLYHNPYWQGCHGEYPWVQAATNANGMVYVVTMDWPWGYHNGNSTNFQFSVSTGGGSVKLIGMQGTNAFGGWMNTWYVPQLSERVSMIGLTINDRSEPLVACEIYNPTNYPSAPWQDQIYRLRNGTLSLVWTAPGNKPSPFQGGIRQITFFNGKTYCTMQSPSGEVCNVYQ